MGWSLLALLVGGAGGFIAGVLVYRNNAKLFEGFIGKFSKLPPQAQQEINDLLKKWGIEL